MKIFQNQYIFGLSTYGKIKHYWNMCIIECKTARVNDNCNCHKAEQGARLTPGADGLQADENCLRNQIDNNFALIQILLNWSLRNLLVQCQTAAYFFLTMHRLPARYEIKASWMRRECRERFPHLWRQWKSRVKWPGLHHGTCGPAMAHGTIKPKYLSALSLTILNLFYINVIRFPSIRTLNVSWTPGVFWRLFWNLDPCRCTQWGSWVNSIFQVKLWHLKASPAMLGCCLNHTWPGRPIDMVPMTGRKYPVSAPSFLPPYIIFSVLYLCWLPRQQSVGFAYGQYNRWFHTGLPVRWCI